MNIKFLSGTKPQGLYSEKLPRFIDIVCDFKRPKVPNIEDSLRKNILSLASLKKLPKGASVGITAGSRGISGYCDILKIAGELLRSQGLKPFAIPAMGSHGGGTAEGRREILKGMGITEKSCGIPIRGGDSYVKIGTLPNGITVYTDREALGADGIIIFNRIKPHTDFEGTHESGLLKMTAVGLGGPQGAAQIHSMGIKGLKECIIPAAKKIFSAIHLMAGLGIVENSAGETAIIKAFEADEIIDGEKKLLKIAKKLHPSLPAGNIDLLVVDRMGKEISGTGMDTHVIGRKVIRFEHESEKPRITRIVVLDLTRQSKGNAAGLALADIITERFFKKIDFDAFYFNAITSTFIDRGKIPVVVKNDREAFALAIKSAWVRAPERARIIRIKDTLSLERMSVSEDVYRSIAGNKSISKKGGFYNLRFDARGNLVR
ncbi:MAG: DUF2088 domain-containing protein [Candidatus Schekmanbacteria bacterium]|nr:DUF2088 domain-containing protein [Candidatus Schekmanbacteria bacterium]